MSGSDVSTLLQIKNAYLSIVDDKILDFGPMSDFKTDNVSKCIDSYKNESVARRGY